MRKRKITRMILIIFLAFVFSIILNTKQSYAIIDHGEEITIDEDTKLYNGSTSMQEIDSLNAGDIVLYEADWTDDRIYVKKKTDFTKFGWVNINSCEKKIKTRLVKHKSKNMYDKLYKDAVWIDLVDAPTEEIEGEKYNVLPGYTVRELTRSLVNAPGRVKVRVETPKGEIFEGHMDGSGLSALHNGYELIMLGEEDGEYRPNGSSGGSSGQNSGNGGSSNSGSSSQSGGGSSSSGSSGPTSSTGSTDPKDELGNLEDYKSGIASSYKLEEASGNIVGIIQTVGVIASVVMLMVIGIKYMICSVEEKANYKKAMIPYLIGAFILFSGSFIPQIVYKIMQNFK